MRGYRELLSARLKGQTVKKVFMFVDATPLIKTDRGYLKTFPLGFLLIDTFDQTPMNLNALFEQDVCISGGNKDRNFFIARCVASAKPNRISINNAGGELEIWDKK